MCVGMHVRGILLEGVGGGGGGGVGYTCQIVLVQDR